MRTQRTRCVCGLAIGLLSLAILPPAQSQTLDVFNPDMLQDVYGLAMQPDGKILVSGFSWIGGGHTAGTTLVRLNPSGTLDAGFLANFQTNYVYATFFAVQPDGKIVTAGVDSGSILRLNPDGSRDPHFNAAVQFGIHSLALQRDGKLLVAGDFETPCGAPRNYLARLNPDGSLDDGFAPDPDYWVYAVALQPDDKILIGGAFESIGGQSQTNIARLNPDGSLDRAFNPLATAGGRWLGNISCLAVQPDGKILVGGQFSMLCGRSRSNVGRLNSDGTLDLTISAPVGYAYPPVISLLLQADKEILVCGGGGIGRDYADGKPDPTWNDPPIAVDSVVMQQDGKIIAGGWFDLVNSQPQQFIARYNNIGLATESLGYDGSNLTWLRGGASPEVWRTTFETSTDGGLSWTSLGEGVRTSGGWRLTGVNVASNSLFRARGYTVGGANNASSWFVEAFTGPPVVVSQPVSITNLAGTAAEFMVYAGGAPPLTYQWLKNGLPLAQTGNVIGASTGDLLLTHVLGADAGAYSAVVTSGSLSITSQVARLTVIDPMIILPPTNFVAQLGGSAAFTVAAGGTAPFAYQWRKNGGSISGATTSSMIFSGLLASDGGIIDVVVSNRWGSIVSAPAQLTINLAVADAFAPAMSGFAPTDWSDVLALGLQPDGKVLVGGQFLQLDGQARTNLGRLNPDGSLDGAFTAQAIYGNYIGEVDAFAVQPDHKILVSGMFTNLAGVYHDGLGRLNPDGSPDPGFNPPGLNASALCVQPDGKILAGGWLRLNPDGSPDMTFAQPAYPVLGVDSHPAILSLALQPDGKILAGGYISYCVSSCQDYPLLERFEADGSRDTNFLASLDVPSNIIMHPGHIEAIALEADGGILVGGAFGAFVSQPIGALVRLFPDGTLDTNFNAGINGEVKSIALQADGRFVIAGGFSQAGGQSRCNLARLNPDGSADPTFDPSLNYTIDSIATTVVALQPDGKILVGGSFTNLAGQSITNLGRLENPTPATQSLTFDGSSLTWLRGGSSPELWRASFAYSLDGNSWTTLGDARRIAGGWQLDNLTAPANAIFRAQGFVTGASSLVESVMPPFIMISDLTRSATGEIEFNALSRAGEAFSIEASPDLKNWTVLQTNISNGSPIHFIDPHPATFPSRYYRLRLL